MDDTVAYILIIIAFCVGCFSGLFTLNFLQRYEKKITTNPKSYSAHEEFEKDHPRTCIPIVQVTKNTIMPKPSYSNDPQISAEIEQAKRNSLKDSERTKNCTLGREEIQSRPVEVALTDLMDFPNIDELRTHKAELNIDDLVDYSTIKGV